MIITTKDKNLVTKESILLNTSEHNIFNYYAKKEIPLNTKINSLIREDDPDPSFIIYNNPTGLRFYDFGNGKTGDFISLVMIKFSLNYYNALNKIAHDIKLNKNISTIITKKPEIIKRKKTEISVIYREWREEDKIFWGSFYISKKTLNHFKVRPIIAVRINGILMATDKLAYSYKIGSRFKIYQPYSNDFKFSGNTNKNSLQGYDVINKEIKDLIIASSLKDVMVLHELGYNAIAPNSENTLVKISIIEDLKNNHRIWLFYDWDDAGINASNLHSKLYDCNQILIPSITYGKDLSDYNKEYGLNKCNKLINKWKK